MEILRHRKMLWFRLSAFGVIGPLELPPSNSYSWQHQAEVLTKGRKS